MAKVWCVQICDEHGKNRLVDRICFEKDKAIDWVKETYPSEKWIFSNSLSDYEKYTLGILIGKEDKSKERVPECSFFFMHGISRMGKIYHWILEERTIH